MNYKKINNLLGDLIKLRNNKIETIPGEDYSSITYEICKTDEEDIFIKIEIYSNSYGEEEVRGIEFVKPVDKKVINYTTL